MSGPRPTPAIRLAPCTTAAQLQAVTDIYAHHVLHGTGTFETEPPSVDVMTQRHADVRDRGLPFLVAETESGVVGFTYAAPFRLRPAFRFTVEDSVYVHPAWLGRGVGRQLLAGLLAAAASVGVRETLALIGDSENEPSLRLHAALGFRRVGLLEKTGFKFDRWLDVVVMQRSFGNSPGGG